MCKFRDTNVHEKTYDSYRRPYKTDKGKYLVFCDCEKKLGGGGTSLDPCILNLKSFLNNLN